MSTKLGSKVTRRSNDQAIREIDAEAARHGLVRVNEYWLQKHRLPDGRVVRRGFCYRPEATDLIQRLEQQRNSEPLGTSSGALVREARSEGGVEWPNTSSSLGRGRNNESFTGRTVPVLAAIVGRRVIALGRSIRYLQFPRSSTSTCCAVAVCFAQIDIA